MGDENKQKKYLSLDGLQLYDSLLKQFISKEDAQAIKAIALSQDGKKLLFYRVPEPVGNTTPAYEFEYPETDLSGVMAKLSTGVTGDILTLGADGGAVDSGVNIDSLVKMKDVEEKIAHAIAQATHMKKSIVTELPTPDKADENTFYLIKDDSVDGDDKFKIYLLIDGTMQMIDDTSMNMSGYLNKEQVEGLIAEAKTQAISDAVAQAGTQTDSKIATAKDDINKDVDKKLEGVKNDITNLTTKVGENTTNIVNVNSRVDELSDTVAGIQAITGDISSISEEDIKKLFE